MSGYIFLEFSNHQNAAEAVAATNNFKLDKQHTFTVNLFSGECASFLLSFSPNLCIPGLRGCKSENMSKSHLCGGGGYGEKKRGQINRKWKGKG
jgi:hypothetical protein